MVACISSVGFESLEIAPRNVVPAWLPWIPALAMIPIAAAVSSMLIPAALARGATYFIASPVSATEEFVRFAFSARTSATWAASDASSPNPRSVEAAISALLAKSSPEAAAKFSIPGIASMISEVVKPAAARFSMPCAASEAEKAVSAPSWIACFFSFSNSSPVAPEIALTRDIWASKSDPTFIAAVEIPPSAADVPVIAAVVTFNPFAVILPSFFSPPSIPEASRSVSITIFPSDNILHLPYNIAK